MRLKQQTQRRDFAQILRGDRRDLEATLPLSDDQPFGDEPAQQFAQCPDARVIVLAQPVKLELLARIQLAENDVGADLAISLPADRIVFGRSGQHGFDTLWFFKFAARWGKVRGRMLLRGSTWRQSPISQKISYKLESGY